MSMKYIMYQQYQIALAQEMSTVTISIIISIISPSKMFFLNKYKIVVEKENTILIWGILGKALRAVTTMKSKVQWLNKIKRMSRKRNGILTWAITGIPEGLIKKIKGIEETMKRTKGVMHFCKPLYYQNNLIMKTWLIIDHCLYILKQLWNLSLKKLRRKFHNCLSCV